DLDQVVQPLAAVAETAGEVLHQRKVELHELVADALALRVALGQLGEPLEQGARPGPVGDRALGPLDAHLGGRLLHRGLRRLLRRLLRRRLLRHCAPAAPRRFCSVTVTRSSGPPRASTSPARDDRTVQAKVSRLGSSPSTVSTETEMRMASPVSSNSHTRSVPGTAWASSIAQASSTAMRRSSISSSVKSRRAARPAVAVRRTDRYALAAGSRTVTTSRTDNFVLVGLAAVSSVTSLPRRMVPLL